MARTQSSIAVPDVDVFRSTLPLVFEQHSFGTSKQASLAHVTIEHAEDEKETDKRYLRMRKKLFDSDAIRAVTRRDIQWRDYLRAHTTPFLQATRLVAIPLVEQVDAEAQRWLAERDQLADAAAEVYEAERDKMREPLGVLFNENDYPPKSRFRSAFWADYRFINFGVPDLLQRLNRDVFNREVGKLEEMGRQARTAIEQHLLSSMMELTMHLRDIMRPKADGKMPALRDGVLDRLMQFLNNLPAMAVVGQEKLAPLVQQIQSLGDGLTVENLRDDKEFRARAAEVMAQVTSNLEPLVETRERAIRFRDEPEAA